MDQIIDWRGNAYSIGSLILYPRMSSRSCEIQEGTVVDIWTTYQCPKTYVWKRLKPGEEIPHKRKWDRELCDYVDTEEQVQSELRVKVKPSGRSSRMFYRSGDTGWGENRVPGDRKEVTLQIIENVTALVGEQP